MTVSADRAARIIVRAVRRGQAECTYPLSAVIAGRLTGLFPGLAASAFAMVDRLLPQPPPQPTGLVPGAAIEARNDSPMLQAATALGRAAAKEYHQVPARTTA